MHAIRRARPAVPDVLSRNVHSAALGRRAQRLQRATRRRVPVRQRYKPRSESSISSPMEHLVHVGDHKLKIPRSSEIRSREAPGFPRVGGRGAGAGKKVNDGNRSISARSEISMVLPENRLRARRRAQRARARNGNSTEARFWRRPETRPKPRSEATRRRASIWARRRRRARTRDQGVGSRRAAIRDSSSSRRSMRSIAKSGSASS